MEQDSYFVIVGSEEGGCSCYQLTKEQLRSRITPTGSEGWWSELKAMGRLPDDIDNFLGMVIIKGRIVVPTAKTVTVEYDLP